jgi:hypothetical protein
METHKKRGNLLLPDLDIMRECKQVVVEDALWFTRLYKKIESEKNQTADWTRFHFSLINLPVEVQTRSACTWCHW